MSTSGHWRLNISPLLNPVFKAKSTPVVVSDSCASHAGVDVHNAGLMILGRFIGKDQLVTTAEFLGDYDNFVKNSEAESNSIGEG